MNGFKWVAILVLLTVLTACGGGGGGTVDNGAGNDNGLTLNSSLVCEVNGFKDTITYVAMGASDAVGVGATIPNEKGYVYLIEDKLAQSVNNVNFHNLGISGQDAYEINLSQTSEAINYAPDVITLWTGGNDIRTSVSPTEFGMDLENILSALSTNTSAEIFIGNLPDMSQLPSIQGMNLSSSEMALLVQNNAEYNTIIASKALAYGAILVDLYSANYVSNPANISADGFHPSDAGYQIMADAFLNQVNSSSVTCLAPVVGSLEITNNSGQAMVSAFISPASSASWGPNQLYTSLSNGSSKVVDNISGGSYDIKVEFENGRYDYLSAVIITPGGTASISFNIPNPELSGTLRIANSTGQEIHYISISSASTSDWGPNELTSPLNNGIFNRIENLPEGTYDVRVQLADTATRYRYNVIIVTGETTTLEFEGTPPVANLSKTFALSSGQLSEVYITLQTSSTWGANVIDDIFYSSGSFKFTNFAEGGYAIKLVFSDGSILYKKTYISDSWGNDVIEFLSPPTTGLLSIHNETGQSIFNVYVSPSSSEVWREDELGGATLAPGESHTLTHLGVGTYNIKVIFADGSIKYFSGGNVSSANKLMAVFGVPTRQQLYIVNNTGQSIDNLYLKRTSNSSWGGTVLEAPVLNGDTTIGGVPVDSFNVKVVLADGSSSVSSTINVVEGFSYQVIFKP